MKKKLWITSLLAALSVSAAAGGITLAKQQDVVTTDAAEVWTVDDINDCSYGGWLDVPAAEVEVGGEKVAATATVTYPDGVTVTGDRVALNQAGLYTITYRAQVGNIHCVEEKKFTVENSAYTFQNEKSSAEYGTYTQYEANSTGLKVRLAPNDTMTFSQLIDVSSLTGTENIVDLFITPNTRGVYDFSKLVIRLTDAVDPSVYMQFQLRRYSAEDRAFNHSYVDVTFANQPWVGCENGTYRHNGWGTPFSFTFYAAMHKNNAWSGEVVDRRPDEGTCKISFNPLTTEAKVSGGHIANLNNPELFETLWTGWPSGKARLTLKAEEVKSETANFCIKDIFGLDLSKTTFAESDAPEVSVSMDDSEMPAAEVNREYAIPAASAYDLYSGACETKVSVYRDYATSTPINVSVLNGKFKPTTAGWHTIVYTATDVLGNVGKEIRNVYVAEKVEEIAITMPENRITSVELGSWVDVIPATYTGGCGIAEMKTTVTFGEETYEITDGFRPEKEGDWVVTYTVTDYIGSSQSAQYAVHATPGTGYITLDTLILPKFFLSDCEYVLPEIYAISYATGAPVKTLCDVDVMVGEEKIATHKAGESFVPVVKTNGDLVKLVYKCGDSILEERDIPTIIVKSDNAKKPIYGENYLYGEGFHTSFKDENGKNYSQGIEIIADAESELCGWTFATPQLMNDFVLEFEGLSAKTTFESLVITLTDSQNPNEEISIELGVKDKATPIIVGDNSLESKTTSLITNKTYKVSYADGKFSYGGLNIAVEKTVNGEEFNGFSSNLAYVRVEMKNAKEGSAYKLRGLNGSNLSSRELEVFAPNLEILGEFGGNKALNDVLEIFPAIAHDVFAPNVEMTMTVFAPDGSVVTDNSGVKLENVATDKSYFITLSQYGKYEVAYSATEKNWVVSNLLQISRAVFVVDETAPQVIFTNATQTTAKVGDTLVCPDVAFRDNLTTEENMRIVKGVYNPYGRFTLFKGEENAIQCAYAGEYKFIVMVFDEFGNMDSVTHTITVEEK